MTILPVSFPCNSKERFGGTLNKSMNQQKILLCFFYFRIDSVTETHIMELRSIIFIIEYRINKRKPYLWWCDLLILIYFIYFQQICLLENHIVKC